MRITCVFAWKKYVDLLSNVPKETLVVFLEPLGPMANILFVSIILARSSLLQVESDAIIPVS
jgi:hypothetical protein